MYLQQYILTYIKQDVTLLIFFFSVLAIFCFFTDYGRNVLNVLALKNVSCSVEAFSQRFDTPVLLWPCLRKNSSILVMKVHD